MNRGACVSLGNVSFVWVCVNVRTIINGMVTQTMLLIMSDKFKLLGVHKRISSNIHDVIGSAAQFISSFDIIMNLELWFMVDWIHLVHYIGFHQLFQYGMLVWWTFNAILTNFELSDSVLRGCAYR